MTVLSDRDIRAALATGALQMTPRPQWNAMQPTSIDLHLGNQIQEFVTTLYTQRTIVPWEQQADLMRDREFDADTELALAPGGFILGHTQEVVGLSRNLVGQVNGKSSLGRLGLSIHCTAGFIDPGFSGQITLELHNQSPHTILLRAGMPICQLVLHTVSSTPERSYGDESLGSRYQGSVGAVCSRYPQAELVYAPFAKEL